MSWTLGGIRPSAVSLLSMSASDSSYDIDASFRDQAFLGGFVGDLASKDILPEALLPWLLHTGDHLRPAHDEIFR